MDDSCVFCKIVAGRAPANKLDETEDLILIPDASPQAPIHLLFVSRSHGEELASVELDKLKRMLGKVQDVVKDRGLTELSYRLVINGAQAALVHNHLHIHLLSSVSQRRPV